MSDAKARCFTPISKSLFQNSLRTLVVITQLALVACGSGGGGGDGTDGSGGGSGGASTSTLNPPASNGATLYEGTTPVNADAGANRFTVAGLSPSASYYVWVHDLSIDASLITYVDANRTVTSCQSTNAGTTTEDCLTVSDDGGNFYIDITTDTSTSYLVTVHTLPGNEGSTASPVTLSADSPYNGQVGSGTSYYVISGLTPGDVYEITMTDILTDADLSVSMLNTFDATCSSVNSGEADETCQVPANFEGRIYIAVDSTVFGAYYTLNATATGATEYIFQGYPDEPVDLTDALPYSGQVNRHGSHYMFTGLTPGVRYEVRINNTTVNTQIYLFDTADFVNVDCSRNYLFGPPYPDSRLCVATAPASGNLYLKIPYYGTPGGTFEIDLGLAPVAQGTSTTPLEIPSSGMPYNGQVDTSYSYYVITGLQAEYAYDIEFNDVTHHYANIAVADSPSNLSTTLGCSSPCAIRTNSSGEIYIRVDGTDTDGGNDLGAWFTLAFGNAENSEGSIASPVSVPTDGSVYNGQVTEIPSYYVASGLNPNQYYLIYDTSDIYGGPSITAYSDSAYSNWICSDSAPQACLAPANGAGEIYIKASYSSISGATFNLWIQPSLIASEGSQASPVDISGTLPSVHAGEVSSYSNDNYSYYVVHGLAGSTNYTVSLTELTDDAYVEVFSDSGFSTRVCSANHTGIDDETCVVQTGSTNGPASISLYIRVALDKIRNRSSAIWDGASYTLTVSEGGNLIASEGTSGAPLDITGSLPYTGEVREDEFSYYMITGLDAGLSYAVKLDYEEGGLGLLVMEDINYATTAVCGSGNISEFSEHCTGQPNASGEMYIRVEGNSRSNSTFTLDLAPAPVAEGSVSVPLDISNSLPYSGQATFYDFSNAEATRSYYRVSGLVPGNDYLVTTSNVTQDAYTSVNGENYCFNNGEPPAESCQVTASSTGEIDLTVEADETGFFDLNLRPAPSNEGSAASPVSISPQTPYQGHSDGTGSYYRVTGLTPYSSHRISLITQDDMQWVKVYTDGSYEHEVCYSGYDTYDIGCGASANAAGEIYFRVGYSPSYYEIYVP